MSLPRPHLNRKPPEGDERRSRQSRRSDKLQFRVSVVVILLIAGMSLWVHTQGDHLHAQGVRLHNEGVQISQQQKMLASQVSVNHQLAAQIQAERVRSIRTGCQAQNTRHDNTITALHQQLAIVEKSPPPGTTAEEIKQSVQANIALINAFEPHQDCKALVKQGTAPPG